MKLLKNKKQLNLSLLLVFIFVLFVSSFFVFLPFSWKQIANALTGDYNKDSGDSLGRTDWNNLDDDFVDKSGDTMGGELNMGGNRISGLANPDSDDDAISRGALNSTLATFTLASAEIQDKDGELRIFCGRTDPGATAWVEGARWYVDVDISEANFTEGSMPYIFTSLGGLEKNEFTIGVGNILSSTAGTLDNLDDMFRVYIVDYNGLSYSTMLTYGWYVNWCAVGK